jgi:hypothetical protein
MPLTIRVFRFVARLTQSVFTTQRVSSRVARTVRKTISTLLLTPADCAISRMISNAIPHTNSELSLPPCAKPIRAALVSTR